ncbi:MAG: hypothetical protein ACLUEF_02345 [Faecalibacterium prausnitzii]
MMLGAPPLTDYEAKSQHISEARAKPGDLVFFKGTYDTPGMSHVEYISVTEKWSVLATPSNMLTSTRPTGNSILPDSDGFQNEWLEDSIMSEKLEKLRAMLEKEKRAAHQAEQPHRNSGTADSGGQSRRGKRNGA